MERVVEAYDGLAQRARWPGFQPTAVPLALSDTDGTYLVRHPSPPEPFEPMRGADAWVADSVPAELRANTEARIDEVWTAAVTTPAGEWDASGLAALLLHETFHVFQTTTHPEWTANEVDLFTYPVGSERALHLRRLETGALRRALTAPDSLRELCWSHELLDLRARRFAALPSEAVAYERGTELREGLARYVESLATGAEPRLPADGFPPEDVRERSYATGHGLAVLLDRLSPGWKEALASDAGEGLDGVLRARIPGIGPRPCGASPDEVGRTRGLARSDLADLAGRRARAREAFEGARGWRVEIVADENRLWPQRFDPLNVRILDGRLVLHDRWLVAGNEAGRIEVLDRTALTRGVGPHPMFDGLDRLWVTGLTEPEVTTVADTVRIAGDGLELELVGAEVEREGQVTRVRLSPPEDR